MRTIDADDLIREINEFPTIPSFLDVLGLIKDAPTVDIVNCINCKRCSERGRWINEHEDGHGSWVGTCDQCNKENRVDNFCPHCGADMRGKDDE